MTTLLSQEDRSASFRIPSMQRENGPLSAPSPPPSDLWETRAGEKESVWIHSGLSTYVHISFLLHTRRLWRPATVVGFLPSASDVRCSGRIVEQAVRRKKMQSPCTTCKNLSPPVVAA